MQTGPIEQKTALHQREISLPSGNRTLLAAFWCHVAARAGQAAALARKCNA
jgi:hypothetical protein